jgi:Voltage gated calcium channel IQ domain
VVRVCDACSNSHHSRIAFSAEEMDQADEELRATVQIIWPLQAKKMLDLLIPRNDGSSSESKISNSNYYNFFYNSDLELNKGKLTVGKIYAGLLILESWKATRFGQIEGAAVPVSEPLFRFCPKNIHTNLLISGRKAKLGGSISVRRLKQKVTHEYISLLTVYTFDHMFL